MKFIRVVIAVYFPITLQGFVNAFNDVTFEFILGTQTGTWKNNYCKLARNKCVDKLLIHQSRTDQLQINRVENKYRYALSSTMKSLNNLRILKMYVYVRLLAMNLSEHAQSSSAESKR